MTSCLSYKELPASQAMPTHKPEQSGQGSFNAPTITGKLFFRFHPCSQSMNLMAFTGLPFEFMPRYGQAGR
jgi:hypothetical protein